MQLFFVYRYQQYKKKNIVALYGRFVTSAISYCDSNINEVKTSPLLCLNDTIEECRRLIAPIPLLGWAFA